MISTKEWRKLVANGNEFYWQVRDIAHPQNPAKDVFSRRLVIRPAHKPSADCTIVFNQMGYHRIITSQHPVIVTPKFVVDCINYALESGWTLERPLSLDNGIELWDKFSGTVSS